MPIREYECQSKKCGCVFEEYEHIDDPPLAKCKICKRGKVIRLISLPARPVVPTDPRQAILDAKAEGKKIAREILKGNQEVIADIYGEDVASGKPKKQAPQPKKLDQVKGGKIKRRTK